MIKFVGKNEREVHKFSPTLMGRIKARPEHLDLIQNALFGVANEPRGTGSSARVKKVTVAGKTGTTQNPITSHLLKGLQLLPSILYFL